MAAPQWIPRRTDVPGIALACCVGGLAYVITHALPPSAFLSDILMALILGAVVLNTPLRRLVKLERPSDEREPDVYAAGLRFTGKWILRASIILMGLKVDAKLLQGDQLGLMAASIAVALPTTFLITHAAGSLLKVRQPLVDLIAGGTMICGASAVNALAPAVGARREEQGIAIGTVFLFSVVALLVFRPIAFMAGADVTLAGLWSGLAVNDLSSAIAVGAQMGPGGAIVAAASKSARILMLGPSLVVLALLRSKLPVKSVRKSALEHVPKFLLGYLGLAGVRMLWEAQWPGEGLTRTLAVNSGVITLMLLTVSAGIGLHLEVRKLLTTSARALVVGAFSSLWMAAVTLGLLLLLHTGQQGAAMSLALVAVMGSTASYRWAASSERMQRRIWERFQQGAPLSLKEALVVLDAFETGCAHDDQRRQLLRQIHPTIGELIPVRESPLPHGEGCRWMTYWEGRSGWALVAVSREPGSNTPIHAHPHRMIGKSIEGTLEELRFQMPSDGEVALTQRRILGHNELVETQGLDTLHIVRAVGALPAIDLQLRGPELGVPGRRMRTYQPLSVDALKVGMRIAVQSEVDDRPGQGGEGASVGRRPF